MKKNPVCAVLWQDAAYTFQAKKPNKLPLPQLTVGFIIKANNKYVFIATNVYYNKNIHTLFPIDGFIIPEKTILEFRKIKNYND